MIEPCPVCGSADVEVRGLYRGTHPIFTGLKRAHCLQCSMAFATPAPGAAALGAYNASYFDNAHGGQSQNPTATAFFSGIARLRLAHIERYLNNQNIAVSSVLEFGPGSGFFARHWLATHPQTAYHACETDTSCHASLRDIGVRLVEASALGKDSMPSDLIVLSHVVEHVTNPIEFLENATQSLRKAGALFIEVPCRDWEHKPVNEPHLLFFDKEPLRLLLRKLGFDSIHVSYHGQEIARLRSPSAMRTLYRGLRSRFVARGLVAPFARIRPGMEVLADPFERAVMAPFEAHNETETPAWWLRAVARKDRSY